MFNIGDIVRVIEFPNLIGIIKEVNSDKYLVRFPGWQGHNAEGRYDTTDYFYFKEEFLESYELSPKDFVGKIITLRNGSVYLVQRIGNKYFGIGQFGLVLKSLETLSNSLTHPTNPGLDIIKVSKCNHELKENANFSIGGYYWKRENSRVLTQAEIEMLSVLRNGGKENVGP